MNRAFKNKLIEMYRSEPDRFGRSIPDEELKKIIRYGVMAEPGDNYFLFLYRDFYLQTAYYGAIIFLNKRDELDRPVTIIGIEQDGNENIRKAYVKAALFFLENDCQDTMTVSGTAAAVFDLAKDKINAYMGKTTFLGSGDTGALEHFDFDIANQTIQCREVEIEKTTRRFHSQTLEKNLQRLEEKEENEVEKKDNGIDSGQEKPTKAAVGLVLKWRPFDLSGERYGFFQPVVVTLREDSSYGSPRSAGKVESTGYELTGVPGAPGVLEDFLTHFTAVDNLPGNPRLKVQVMNQIYFKSLADQLFHLPDELTFSQWDDRKDYLPLKKFTFHRVTVHFAPSPGKAPVFRFMLSFTSGDGQVLKAGIEYEIFMNKGQGFLYVSFVSAGEESWFAAAEQPAHLYRFFDFLAAQKEFYVYDLEEISTALKRIESPYLIIHPEPLKKYELYFMPTPVLNLYPEDRRIDKEPHLEIEFDYQGAMKQFIAQHPDKEICIYKKNEEFENRCREVLKSDPLLTEQMDYNKDKRSVYHYYNFKEGDALKWLLEKGRKYLEKGFKIYSTKWKRYFGNTGSSLWINVSMGTGDGTRWLEFKPFIHDPVSGEDIEIDLDGQDLLDAAANMIIDKKGRLHLVTGAEIDKLAQLYRYGEQHGSGFRVPGRNYLLVRSLYDKRMESIPEIRETLAMEERLKEFETIPDYPLSGHFKGQLRAYQQEGFKWLYFLRDYGFSGCLADDMGLGKTVQTLALLQTLKDQGKLKSSLLVLPVSAVPNWEAEIRRFTPRLTYYTHIGPSRDKDTGGWKEKDLIITSYATLRNDIEIFTGFDFDYIILDESQNIKNIAAQVTKAVKVLKGKNRLALSGTPIENNTMELWSLFDFLLPGFLGSSYWFNRQFVQAIEKDRDEARAELLKKMIYPFVLRRKKQDVETELPEKVEILSTLRMDDEQLKTYAELARYYREEVGKTIDERGVGGSSMKILEGMLRLRQICLFPHLVDEAYREIPSAKFDHFVELLEDILSEDHKVLIFSQFVEVLKILRDHCDRGHIEYAYIDGSVNVKNRKTAIQRFQEEENTRAFLLSLKAGGVALNLTAADYVIIFDPWWNPAVEAQAIDRSHRIGQTKKVMVYRMVVQDTIEQKMLELQERKKALVENLITADLQVFKKLKKEDILSLFS